jgi:hypothetical protein
MWSKPSATREAAIGGAVADLLAPVPITFVVSAPMVNLAVTNTQKRI